jgi:hypothetical protein
VEINAWIDGEKTHAENSYILEPLTPGKVFDLLKYSRITGVSAIGLAILSRPQIDRLIIAMDGLATPNKVSSARLITGGSLANSRCFLSLAR